jgi:glycosyltransferase involved in cell wall biosynthesis
MKLANIENVIVTGYVEDIRDFYWMADVCVIHLRIARGLQNKVIEAMATGNAVVVTSNASDGIVCKQNVDIIIADDKETFAREVVDLLHNKERREKLGKSAVENVKKHYSWEENLKQFDHLIC